MTVGNCELLKDLIQQLRDGLPACVLHLPAKNLDESRSSSPPLPLSSTVIHSCSLNPACVRSRCNNSLKFLSEYRHTSVLVYVTTVGAGCNAISVQKLILAVHKYGSALLPVSFSSFVFCHCKSERKKTQTTSFLSHVACVADQSCSVETTQKVV